MNGKQKPLDEPFGLTRRHLLQICGVAAAAWNIPAFSAAKDEVNPLLREAIARLEYLTPLDRAFILDKGKTGIQKLPPEKIREIGLVPETWSCDVVPDPAGNSIVGQPFSRALGNALTWAGLEVHFIVYGEDAFPAIEVKRSRVYTISVDRASQTAICDCSPRDSILLFRNVFMKAMI